MENFGDVGTMARKHEKFSYNYGWKTAPEQWNFFYNGKRINLDDNTRDTLACMCISGKVKETEDILKRMLRKEEKQDRVQKYCIAFFEVNSDRFYYTQNLAYDKNDLQDALRCYKEWKQYILSKGCELETEFKTISGYITPDGYSNGKDITEHHLIDLTRCHTVKLVERRMFA